MDLKILPVAVGSLPQGKPIVIGGVEEARVHGKEQEGLVGFINISNSCYMNATLQALSNCPPFRQYFVDGLLFSPSSSSLSTAPSQLASNVISILFKKMWASERHTGHLSARVVSSAMKQRMFKGSQQQDAQEFLRCLLTQIHDEISICVPPAEEWTCGCSHGSCTQGSCDLQHRDSMVSCDSDTSSESHSSQSRLVASPLSRNNSVNTTMHSSPPSRAKPLHKYSKVINTGSIKSSEESLPAQLKGSPLHRRGKVTGGNCITSVCGLRSEHSVEWTDSDVFVADIVSRRVRVHRSYLKKGDVAEQQEGTNQTLTSSGCNGTSRVRNDPEHFDPQDHGRAEIEVMTKMSNQQQKQQAEASTPNDGGSSAHHSKISEPRMSSIVSQVFEGTLESRVKCLSCKVVSVTREPFQDLSLPIPGRKEMAKFNAKSEQNIGTPTTEEEEDRQSALSRGFCTVWNYVTAWTREMLVDPPTTINDCMNAFFDTSELKGDNRYFCSNCKSFQNSLKEMSISELPEVLCIHLKRFRFDVYFSSKISRHIYFPLTKLDMGRYFKNPELSSQSHMYDLNAVITHYGGAAGGHYVTFAKNSCKNTWFEFNDTRVSSVPAESVQNTEGYVLFYRRVPPSGSQVLHSLDTASLLPPSGTTIPSPDVCYISRHWLHLLRYCVYPGPISQFNFACKHGGILPIITREEARSLALIVTREIWEVFHLKYGGGPLVQKLEVCVECKELLLLLNDRRKMEMDYVHKVQSNEKKNGSKIDHFLLPMVWLQHWQLFIKCTNLDIKPPGTIDNTNLLQQVESSDDGNAYNLEDSAAFRRVSSVVWQYFHTTYGGGPVLVSSLEPFLMKVI